MLYICFIENEERESSCFVVKRVVHKTPGKRLGYVDCFAICFMIISFVFSTAVAASSFPLRTSDTHTEHTPPNPSLVPGSPAAADTSLLLRSAQAGSTSFRSK